MIYRGPNTAHGRGTPSTIPAWRSAMAANTWAEIPGNTLADIDPAASATYNPNYPSTAPWAGTGGQIIVSRGWNSTVFDRATDTLWIPLAGGHTDYAGNEPYKICLRSETPNWSMIRPPSGAVGNTITLNDGQEATGLYSDGRLRSVHSYTNNAYVDGLGPVITRTNAHFSSAAGRIQKVYAINETTGEASVLSDYTALSYPDPVGSSDAGGCYDPSRGVIWHIGSATARMLKTVVATGVTTAVGEYNNLTQGDGSCMIYVSTHDVIMVSSSVSPYFRVFDPVTELWTSPTISGSYSAGLNNNYPGMDWCPDLGKMLMWNNASATTEITTLTPGANPRTDAWTTGILTVSGANAVTPPARPSGRTHKRFGYSTNLKGCYLFQSNATPIYFFATE